MNHAGALLKEPFGLRFAQKKGPAAEANYRGALGTEGHRFCPIPAQPYGWAGSGPELAAPAFQTSPNAVAS